MPPDRPHNPVTVSDFPCIDEVLAEALAAERRKAAGAVDRPSIELRPTPIVMLGSEPACVPARRGGEHRIRDTDPDCIAARAVGGSPALAGAYVRPTASYEPPPPAWAGAHDERQAEARAREAHEAEERAGAQHEAAAPAQAQREAEQAQRETEQAQRETDQPQREMEQVQREMEQAQRETDQPQREAEQAQRETEQAQRDAVSGQDRVAASPPDPGPFRVEVLRARAAEPAVVELPRIAGSRWAALSLLTVLVAALFGLSLLGRVEVTSKATGSMRVGAGPKPVLARAAGVVATLSVAAGQRLAANQPIATLEAAALTALVERNASEVELLRAEADKAERIGLELHGHAVAVLEDKRALLQRQAALKQRMLSQRKHHADKLRRLANQRVAAEPEALSAEAAVVAVREELLSLRQQVADIALALAEREEVLGRKRLEREFQIKQAEVALAEARTRAGVSQVVAPFAGRLESLLLTRGQVVQEGETVAQLVPDGDALSAVVFAPARDAPFIAPGLSASVELMSLPVGDFGRARAKVTRVGADRALPAEIVAVLGQAPESGETDLVRVELTIDGDDKAWKAMAPKVRSGAAVIARIETRKRRILSLLFDFLR